MEGILYIVGTPIGNLGDVSLRALEVLKSVDCIYAEDTRVTMKLLDRYEIKKDLRSYREAADRIVVERIIKDIIYQLHEGKCLAYVSDAGTPGVSDPGNYLVKIVEESGHKVVPIPGAIALATLISVSGFPVMHPLFVGFLPKKKGKQTLLSGLKGVLESEVADSIIFYESPERIVGLLEELQKWGMPLQVCLGRELTKMHEEVSRGLLESVYDDYRSRKNIKGEIVLLVFKDKL